MKFKASIEVEVTASSADEAMKKVCDELALLNPVPFKLYVGTILRDYIGKGVLGRTKGGYFTVKELEIG
jgi:hypothetical protein